MIHLIWLLVLGAISVVGWTVVLVDFASAWHDRRRRKRHEIINLTPIIPIARARMLRRQRIPTIRLSPLLSRDAARVPSLSLASPGLPHLDIDAEPAAVALDAVPGPGSTAPQGHRVRYDSLRPFDHCHDDEPGQGGAA